MSRVVYRIEMIDLPPVYKTTKKEIYAWYTRNPGEGQSWTTVDILEELDSLNEQIDRLTRETTRLENRIAEILGDGA